MNLNSFNVADFDKHVQSFYEGNNTERQHAQTLLTEFRKNPDSWQAVDQILEQSSSLQSKFIALGILQEFIRVKWNLLPLDQRLNMRNYVVKLILELASNENTLRSRNAYINKLDQILVQILKKDWPKYWPTFIQEMIDSSLANATLCENNMKILKYLSEEVFDFSDDFMTMTSKTRLKNQMVNEFSPVFDMCKNVLSTKSTNLYLTTSTLETLLKFIIWIPHQYLFQQDLMQILDLNFKQAQGPFQRNLSLQCFTELINLENLEIQQYSAMLLGIFNTVYNEMTGWLPSSVDLNQVYCNLSDEEQDFFRLLIIFLTTFLSKYQAVLESVDSGSLAIHGTLQYILKFSRVPEPEIWKICLEFWSTFTCNINPSQYQDVLQDLCNIMIDNMVNPDDVFMIENEDGEITREFIKQSDTTSLSKSMQTVFNQLTRTYPIYVQTIIHEKLKQFQLSNTTWGQLFRLSWAIGFTSSALTEQDEDIFLNTVVIQGIFQLLQMEQNNQDQEWVVASCLFYIAEQFPRFLMSHSDFTSVLFQRIFGYMQHQNTDVREMSCNAFIKISKKCNQSLYLPFLNGQSILDFALINLKTLTAQLDSTQILLFYGSVSTIIASSPSQEQAINALMETSNTTMNNIILTNMDSLTDLKTINNIVRINIAACGPLGSIYQYQLQKISPSLIQIYEMTSQHKGQKTQNFDIYRRICESILKLVEMFILSQEYLENQRFVFELLQIFVINYKNSEDPAMKEFYVLRLMTSLIKKLDKPVWPELLKEIVDIEFVSTLPLISSNFVDYPDLRLEFYRLLQALNQHCFTELYQSSQLFQLNIDSIMWGTKHTVKDISEIALQTCFDMIQYVSQMEDEDISSQFFELYYVRILTDILEVLVDPDCRNGFMYQSQVLSRLLELVQEGEIYTRLFKPEQVADPLMSNVDFIQQYVLDLLCTAFPLLQKDQVEVLVRGMFEYSGELERFQDDIQDFLIDIREVGDESEGQQRKDEELNAELDLLRNA